jgi:dynein heavy chain
LTGTLQNYARKETIAVDKLDFEFNFKDTTSHEDIKEKPENGCLFYGLFIEGCKWDFKTHGLAESDPKKLFVDLPLLHLVPVAERAKP